jgi:hypothetical protein
MSKRDLKKYLESLDKDQLELQIIALYDKYPPVKTYYDFVFNPKEEVLLRESKLKIKNEYFPVKGKRPKARRSVAQKYIKHFLTLGVDSFIIADVMLYSIEVAQIYCSEKKISQEAFFKSILNSLNQAIHFLIENSILNDFKDRILTIIKEVICQKWTNEFEFRVISEKIQN